MDTEGKLIRKVKNSGDRAAADTLVRSYYDEIYRFVFRQAPTAEDALDITQECFIGMLRSIGGYQPAQAGFRTWLYKIAANKLVDFYRSRSRTLATVPLDLEIAEPAFGFDLQKRMEDGAFAKAVNKVVATLPADTQSIFRLHIWGERSFREIAMSLQMPESSVKTKYYRLISLLRGEFSDYGS